MKVIVNNKMIILPETKTNTKIEIPSGFFYNMDGYWFYIDYTGESVCNNKKIGLNLITKRPKPIFVYDGDEIISGI